MQKIEGVVQKFGTKLTPTGTGWFNEDAGQEEGILIFSLEGHIALNDAGLDLDQQMGRPITAPVIVVNPQTREFWAVPLDLAAWIYEEEAPEGELLRRRLRLDCLNGSSWLYVGGHAGAHRCFDKWGDRTEKVRVLAQDWSRNGSWAKY